MQVLGIVGSMRKDRHTHTLVTQVIDEMGRLDPQVSAQVLQISDQTIQPCRVTCSQYCTRSAYRCAIPDDVIPDDVNEILSRMIAADALVIGAPLYFRAPPAKFQALAERLISIFFFNETQGNSGTQPPLRGKPCGLVAVAEYSNPHQILEYLHDFCSVLKMKPVTLEHFPYLGVAGQGEVRQDAVIKPFERAKELAAGLLEAVYSGEKSFD
jgi:multimeric flavodoxin WrbA